MAKMCQAYYHICSVRILHSYHETNLNDIALSNLTARMQQLVVAIKVDHRREVLDESEEGADLAENGEIKSD